jgi:hypothetical protein
MYFRQFPKIPYSFNLTDQGTVTAVTNIFARFSINSSIVDNAFAFYKYQVEDTDTPETIAYKQYGDPELHWIIILVNQINDPLFELPLPIDALEEKIIKQYGYTSIAEAYSTIHHYEFEVKRVLSEVDGPTTTTTNTSIVTLEQYNYASNTIITQPPNTTITQNVTFYANNSNANSATVATLTIASTYKPVYVYDHELDLNESKRQIKILKPQYIEYITEEIGTTLNA